MSSPQSLPSGQPSPPAGRPAGGGPRRRLRIPSLPRPLVAGLAVAALVGTVITAGLRADDAPGDRTASGVQSPSRSAAPPWTAEVAARLKELPALRYSGAFTSGGRPAWATLSVTRSGSAIGTITRDGRRALLVSVGGATYLKGPAAFWTNSAGPTALPEDFAGRWAKAPVTTLGFDIRSFLAPSSIAELVRRFPGGGSGEVDGRPVYRIQTALGTYSVTVAQPHELLRVEGVAGARFDVTAVPDAAPVLTELRRRVAALGGARDPGVRFEHGGLKFVNCNENVSGCTVRLEVSTRSPVVANDGSSATAAAPRVRMTATISADGRALGSCTDVQPLNASRKATLSCTVTSRGWREWMRRARDVPGRHEYTAQARVVAEALSARQVAELLAAVDQERRAG